MEYPFWGLMCALSALILVRLNPSSNGIPVLGGKKSTATLTFLNVLILLLMEYPFWDYALEMLKMGKSKCLNPSSNGIPVLGF